MREQGVAHATTKEIARAAGCSEALLYRHFDDKQGLFMAVLGERLPGFALPDDAVGTGTVEAHLARLVSGLLDFYVRAPSTSMAWGSAWSPRSCRRCSRTDSSTCQTYRSPG